jgi:ribose-phosphate pyrophosphokinase
MPKFQLKLFSGTSHEKLAKDIAKKLGVKVSPMEIYKFACGEIYARSLETVRGCNVFIVQTATQNVNEDLMRLFVIIDALKRSFAKRIHVVMPHYAYARQDRVALPREPISAKLVADLVSAAGADHLIAVTLHSDQEQGFFDFPVDNLNCLKLFTDYFKKKKLKDITVVSPDAGGAKDAKKLADKLGATLAVIHKARPAPNKSQVTHVVGEVKGRTCVLYDDMIDTGGSICAAKEALIAKGAKKDVYVAATHPVFSDPATERLSKAGFKEVIVTDSIPISKDFKGLKVLSIAPLLAATIKCVHEEKSVTANL